MNNYRYWCLKQIEIDILKAELGAWSRVIYQHESLGTLRVSGIHKPSTDYRIDFINSPSRLLVLLRPDQFFINGKQAFERDLGPINE